MPRHTKSERSKKKNSETNSGGHQPGFSPKPQKSGALSKRLPPKKSSPVGRETNSGGNQTGL